MGKLFVVATPIGNLRDITLRALEVLNNVEIIAAEDTRHVKKLLSHYGISSKKLLSYHEYNEEDMAEKIIQILEEKDVAIVSDAGTPCISDPGYRVVKKAREKHIEVIPIPGPFAAAAALSASGLPSDKFLFVGFLPSKETEKEKHLNHYINLGYTFILYESPKRVLKTVSSINKINKDADIVIAKELTKIYETFIIGKPNHILEYFQKHPESLKGEFVILVYPNKLEELNIQIILQEAKKLKKEGRKTKEIAKILSQKFGISKNFIYDKIVESEDNKL